MVVGEPKRSIMEGIENTGDVRLHDHRLRLKQRFDIIRKLGQGTYGKVQLGINKKTGQEVAIKTIKKCKIETEADLVRIRREVQIMSSVRHPNIVHIYEVFENSEKMILVMEYCAGGELYDYLSQQKVLQEDEARRLFRQIATAVYYCHKHKICHRDLKLENVLLDEHGSAKIADFGLSNVFEERRLLSTFCGSPLYASPEIVKGTPYIGPEVDCWSLGVLLYTLVYGAMPFDGSNFKRLVKQISTGDYFEPKNPSSASPLIRDMLTVDPIQRADITHICDNPWVNKGSDVSCLELAEALANETPVRLDLLLSLAPPPTIGSDKLVVTDEVSNAGADGSPARSMSVANIDNSAERRILEMVAEGGTDAIKPSPTRTIVSNDQPKRKLETTVSMDSAPSQRKKERSVRSSSGSRQNIPQNESEVTVLPYVENNVGSKQVEESVPMECQKEVNDEVQNNASQLNQNDIAPTQASPIKPPSSTVTTNMSQLTLEIANDIQNEPIIAQVPEEVSPVTAQTNKEPKPELKTKDPALKEKNNASKTTTAVKKKVVLSPSKKDDKSKSTAVKEKSPPRKSIEKDIAGRVLISDKKTEDKKSDEAPVPNDAQSTKQPTERRRSRILDTAVKLNNLSIQPTAGSSENAQSPPPPAKPKKVIIPGVSVGSFKEQFERRASLTSGNVPAPSNDLRKNSIKTPAVINNTTNNKTLAGKKVNSVDSEHPPSTLVNENKDTTNIKLQTIGIEPSPLPQPKEEPPKPLQEPKKPAIVEVNKVSKLLHKSESLKEPSRKDALTTNLSLEDARRNLQQSMALLNQAKSDVKPVENTDDLQNERQKQLKTAREIISNAIGSKPPVPYGSGGRSSSGTISLNSLNSLPGSPPTSPPHPRPLVRESPARTFRTEVQHRVDDVRNRYLPNSRGGSVERIIPIHFADDNTKVPNSHTSSSGQLPYQRNNSMPFRLGSLPRGCTPDFETERTHQPSTPVTPATPSTPASISRAEPIKKSPREFIIPIAVEGKGYVTPRQGSLEPSETPSKLTPTNIGFASRFPKPRRLSSLVSGGESEDEDDLHMHRLRSSRRVRADAEKESVSSGEEDDDEGFELLTAENLFSTLLDRVRSLTNKLNGEEGTGFPQHHQSLFNNFHSPFFNSPHLPRKHKRHNIMREGPSWRRSTSRDIGTDFDSIFPSHPTFPRGSKKSRKAASNKCNQKSTHPQMSSDLESDSTKNTNESETNSNENLDLSDLDFSKMELSEKDMETLSGLTPALSRRLQKQLLDHLPPAAARSLRRTLSMNCPNMLDGKSAQHKYTRSLSASKYSDKKVSLLEEENISSIKSDQNDQFIKNENQIDKNSLHKISNKYKLSSFDDEDTSSISYSSTLSKPDKDNNNIPKSNSREYSDSNILKRDQSGNSLDINNSKMDGLSVTESITPRLLSGMRDTPDRSVLSKYFSPEKNVYMDDYSQNRNKNELENVTNEPYYTSQTSQNTVLNNIDLTGSLRRRSTRTPPVETTPRRKISRFLRPDFFDTPREESIYVRDKKDKETETQKVLKEIREKRSRSASSPNSPSISNDVPFFDSISKTSSRNCLSPVSPTTPNRSRSVTPFYPILDNISEAQNDYNANKEIHETLISVDKKLKSSSNNSKTEIDNCISVPTPVDINANNKVNETCAQFTLKESKLTRPKSFPSKPTENLCIFGETVDDKNNLDQLNSNNAVEKTSVKESKIARPKSYPTTTPSPEKKSINIPVNEIGISKNIKKDETNLNTKDHSTVVASLREKTPILSDNNGNVAVSFNINLPSKNAKPLKAEEKVPQGNCEEEIKKVSPVKKKVVVKKKTSSLKLASAKNSSNDSNKIENSIENKETDCAKTIPKENDSKSSPVKKKSVLQSIGQKFEKLRNDSFNKLNSQEKESTVEKTQKAPEVKDEPKVTRVENSMRVLREQSVPVVQVEPITESGLIKRAVTITNLPTLDNKESSSKKSVNRVLGLFKKVEPKDKTNKSGLIPNVEKNKESSEPLPNPDLDILLQNDLSNDDSNSSQVIENKPKRPTSLLLNGIGKRVQACYNGATSDSVISKSDKKFNNNIDNGNACKSDETKSQKKGLRLDFSRLPKINQNIFNKRNSLDLSKSRESSVTKDLNGNQKSDTLLNNGAQQSDSLKPNDSSIGQSKSVNHDIEESFSNGDISTQDPNWSPDYDANKLMSSEQQSKSSEYTQNSHHSHDVGSPEPENIIDRIRRKSFYSRFNEKKNRRKSLLVGPGAKEYIPSARINPQCENDNLHYASKYDLSPASPTKYVPSALNFDHARPSHSLDKVDCLTPTSPRLRSMIGNDPFLSGVHKSTERADQKYPDFGTSSGIDSGSYSIPRYPRTISYFDNFDSKSSASTEPKSTSARYGRTLSLLSPGIYATYSPRSHTRNPAILLRDSAEIESNSEDILTKIRNRKKAAAQNSYVDDDHSLDTKFRSNHMHDSEHDLSADKVE